MPPTRDSFTIGRLARAAGVPTTTVRYYERIKLLKPESRGSSSNYRTYTSASLGRLRFIRTAQSAGLTLDDIAELMLMFNEQKTPCKSVQAVMQQRLNEVNRRLKELRTVRSALQSALDACRCAPSGGLCAAMGKSIDCEDSA